LHFAFADRGLDRIVSIYQIGNDASERVMQKLGMRLDRETIDPSCNRAIRVYAITRDEYNRTLAIPEGSGSAEDGGADDGPTEPT